MPYGVANEQRAVPMPNGIGPPLNWRLTGPQFWPYYRASIAATNNSAGVRDTLITPSGTYPGTDAFVGGVLLPDGRVYCVPYSSATARIYDPVRDTLVTPSGTYPGTDAFSGGVLLPDGRVFCVPRNSTSARIYGGGESYSMDVLLSGYFNKY